uniref:Glutamine amidotransferase type-2 domain-containing protein n=1 Tax=Phenylobacterium glaciei TaxID=2803784 RepID=A0A974SBE0_9CAUL|nr:hypothetical protein JKL49_12480 [Phenylobacterium glaciei]
MAFTDGRQIGATLDRNGLRPARFVITDQDHVIMASEMGVLVVPEERVVRKWRLQPGKMLLIDMEEGRIIEDEEIKASSPTPSPMPIGWPRPSSSWRTCLRPRPPKPCWATTRTTCWIASRPLATPRRTCPSSWSPWPRPARTPSARWAATFRSRFCPSAPSCSTTTSSRTSPRSPTRPSTRSAKSW